MKATTIFWIGMGLPCLFAKPTQAQTWTRFTDSVSVELEAGTAFWFDQLGDGYQDVWWLPAGDTPEYFYVTSFDSLGYQGTDSIPLFLGNQSQWAMGDLNRDIWVDFVQSGWEEGEPVTRVWEDIGGGYERSTTLVWPVVGELTVIDWDHDGGKDIVVAGQHQDGREGLWWIHEGEEGWLLEDLDSLLGHPNSSPDKVWFADVNLNGWEETLVRDAESGKVYLYGRTTFKPRYKCLDSTWVVYPEQVAFGDLDGDAFPEICINGFTEAGGTPGQWIMQNDSGVFTGAEVPGWNLTYQEDARLYIADVSGDGAADIVSSGYSEGGLPRTLLYAYQASEGMVVVDTLLNEVLPLGFAFGHADEDGQLEMAASEILTDTTRAWNFGPNPVPVEPITLEMIGESLLILWSNGEDDRTAAQSLGYDIRYFNEEVLVVPGDFESMGYRFPAGPARVLQGNRYALQNIPAGNYRGLIQVLDNAFWTARCYPSLGECFCSGSAPAEDCPLFAIAPCFSLQYDEMKTCEGDTLVFTNPYGTESMEWTNAQGEVLGVGASISWVATGSEEEHIVGTHKGPECYQFYSVAVAIQQGDPAWSNVLGPDTTLCVGDSLRLVGLEDASIQWWLNGELIVVGNGGLLITSDVAPATFTVHIEGQTAYGCPFQDTLTVNYSVPTLSMPEEVSIFAGESITLDPEVSVGGYHWSPPYGLSDTSMANPTASPKETTLYTLEVTDAFGCTISEEIEVQVKGALFIPDLFTPNGDGDNDFLKLYGFGITYAEFRVYSRDGRLVYSHNDINTLLNSGWDGVFQGNALPPDTYIWTLSGEYLDGEALTYQGQTTGTIRLVR